MNRPDRRALTLIAVFAAGFSSIFLLPESYGLRNSAVIKTFPAQLGEWRSLKSETPQRVADILGPETDHESATFFRDSPGDAGGLFDRLSMFIVLSGSEMNASIHRPERCFPTQGFTITDSSQLAIPIPGSGRTLEVTRLASLGRTDQGNRLPRLSYYWFVGHDRLTNSHYERAWIDIKDRVLEGSNQRWAYVMATIEYDFEAPRVRTVSEAEADEILQEFLAALFPHIHRVDALSG